MSNNRWKQGDVSAANRCEQRVADQVSGNSHVIAEACELTSWNVIENHAGTAIGSRSIDGEPHVTKTDRKIQQLL